MTRNATPRATRPPRSGPNGRTASPASVVRVLDGELAQDLIRRRQERGADRHDEVWDGVYVLPPLANNPHQALVGLLTSILNEVVGTTGLGHVYPGANVSDRRDDWEHNYRCPDVVVVLHGGRAVDCGTHFQGGPDFLIEIESPGDETDQKIPFYSGLQVRELLILHRDTRALRLFRHDGRRLVRVGPTDVRGKKWLASDVVPLAFRRRLIRRTPRTEVRRTHGEPGSWTV